MSSAKTVSQKSFNEAEIARLGMIYSMVGLREFGLGFEADKVPAEHMKGLVNNFIAYQAEIGVSEDERQVSRDLLARF